MSDCFTLIQGTRMRATLIDSCGNPVPGSCSQVVSDGFISVAMTDQLESGDEYKTKNASGDFCVNQRSKPKLNWIEVTITMCKVDPSLYSLLTGAPLVYDDTTPTPLPVGFGTDSDKYATASFALEVWTNIGRNRGTTACAGGATRYGYLLLPWLLEGTMGDMSIENKSLDVSVKAITADGNDWGVGPYNVINNKLNHPSPLLAPIPPTRHRHLQFTTLAPPANQCGCQTLVLPS